MNTTDTTPDPAGGREIVPHTSGLPEQRHACPGPREGPTVADPARPVVAASASGATASRPVSAPAPGDGAGRHRARSRPNGQRRPGRVPGPHRRGGLYQLARLAGLAGLLAPPRQGARPGAIVEPAVSAVATEQQLAHARRRARQVALASRTPPGPQP